MAPLPFSSRDDLTYYGAKAKGALADERNRHARVRWRWSGGGQEKAAQGSAGEGKEGGLF